MNIPTKPILMVGFGSQVVQGVTTGMGRIRVLPDHLANQIAAGEVVERPASALKELVENSLDAGARQIRVYLEAGGKRRIRVEDDGSGMDRDDCLMALERHATSKLTRAEDLFSIKSLGFRGEALPSIASVSQMMMESRTADTEVGVRITMRGAKILEVKEVPRNPGTTIEVNQLFFNIPARRKFLRSTETELGWMVNLITQYSMAHIDKGFYLEHNGKPVIDVKPVATLPERIYQHYGKAMLDELIPFEAERDWLGVRGLASSPNLLKSSRSHQFLFVNGRLVRDKVLAHAIGVAYEGFGEGRIFPVIFLFLTVPSTEVDVNVHPAKTEVKFIHANFVHDAVQHAIREALVSRPQTIPYRFREGYHAHPTSAKANPWSRPPQRQEALPGQTRSPLFDQQPAATGQSANAPAPATDQPSAYERFLARQGSQLTESDQTQPAPANPGDQNSNAPLNPPAALDDPPKLPLAPEEELPLPRIIGQFRDSFILAEDRGDLLLIDQHVAHERILYDQIKQGLAENQMERQVLLVPETVELTPAQSVALQELLPFVRRFGFDLDPFDGNTYVIREIPTFAVGQDLARLVGELVEKAQGMRDDTAIEAMLDLFAATKACKAAVKINMHLTPEKMHHFIETLWHSSSPLFCPHGRPIILRFRNEEIEKNFLRR